MKDENPNVVFIIHVRTIFVIPVRRGGLLAGILKKIPKYKEYFIEAKNL